METPYFLIHTGLLEENYHAFDRALNACWGRHRIAYSVKTNSLPFVLRFLHERGAMAEVVSDDEYALAGLCGFAPEEIVFNGPIKGKDCFLNAVLSGARVHMDSRRELDWLDLLPQDRLFSVGLRVNLDLPSLCSQDVGLEGEGYRFGFSYENGDLAWALSRLAAHKNLRLGGLHLHCNSITRSPRVYGFMARKTADICREFGLLPDYVDMGGGFFGGVPGKPAPEEYVQAMAEPLQKALDPKKTELVIEPGSALIGSAADLVTTVLDVKENLYGRIVTTDGGRVNLDPLWKKEQYTYEVSAPKRASVPLQIVCGYTCMDHDRIMRLVDAPALEPGDIITYKRVGAYTMTFESMFIRRHPEVYAETDGHLRLIRSKPSMETFKALLEVSSMEER